MSGLQLAGISVIVIIALGLITVGIATMRAGIKALPNASSVGQEPVWYKHPKILFGLNNIVFAVLLCLVLLLGIVTSTTAKLILVILLIITFLLSLFLVIRSVLALLRAAKKLREQRTHTTP